MAKQTLTTIKNWFKTGLKPTQIQFWETWDSFWHKDEQIPATKVEDLPELLNAKADRASIDGHVNDHNNPHQVTVAQIGLDKVDNTRDLDKPVSREVQTALDAKATAVHTHEVDEINGLIDINGTINPALLPSYVDDVIEAETFADLPIEGEKGKIYVAKDDNKVYRWSGSTYIEIVASPGSTDNVPEGVNNLYFKPERILANDILDKLKTVDGVGSGLNADLFQGANISTFLRENGNLIGIDLNTITTTEGKWTIGAGCINTPVPSNNSHILLNYVNQIDTSCSMQMYINTYPYTYEGNAIYVRSRGNGNVFTPWRKITHDGNDWCYYKDRSNRGPDTFLINVDDGTGIGAYAWQKESTNAPQANAGSLITIPYLYNPYGDPHSLSWTHQLAFANDTTSGGAIWYRSINHNSFGWSNWVKLFHSGNSNKSDVDWKARGIYGVTGTFSGTVSGADGVNPQDFVTKKQNDLKMDGYIFKTKNYNQVNYYPSVNGAKQTVYITNVGGSFKAASSCELELSIAPIIQYSLPASQYSSATATFYLKINNSKIVNGQRQRLIVGKLDLLAQPAQYKMRASLFSATQTYGAGYPGSWVQVTSTAQSILSDSVKNISTVIDLLREDGTVMPPEEAVFELEVDMEVTPIGVLTNQLCRIDTKSTTVALVV